MCLSIRNKKTDNSHIKTAKQTIVVYKYLKMSDDFYVSPFRSKTKWKLDNKVKIAGGSRKSYQVINNIDKYWSNRYYIYKGIHAYTSKDNRIIKNKIDFNRYSVFKCYIPKGSKYILGYNGEIVTTHLLLKEKLN